MNESLHHVVIIGGGFGGVYAARTLSRAPVRITILDRKNHHTFQPLLYQVATAGLNPADIAAPIRRIFRRQRNVEVLLADVSAINPAEKSVSLSEGGEIAYDTLILATGATHSYFGHDEWARFAPGLKTLEDALEIRKRVFFAYEAAEREHDPERRKALLTFVVVGGGPTGVELAGALAEIAMTTLTYDFRHIDPTRARILLLEAAPSVLGTYPEDLREKARAQLEHLGVTVRTGAMVTAIDSEGVTLRAAHNGTGEERIEAATVLWGAGVAASPLARSLGVPLDRAGRVKVEPDLTIPGHPDVYAIGDVMAFEQDGALVPGVAPVAIQSGKHAGKNIRRALSGKAREPFRYLDKGSLATIGRAAAVAELGKLKLSGFLAWLAWILIHIFFLIGYRNRVLVLFEWAWSYITYDRGARLITGNLPAQLIHSLRPPPPERDQARRAAAPPP